MHVDQLPSMGALKSTIEDERQRLSESDLADASRSALTSVRDALPDSWTHRQRSSRWPWVAIALLGVTLVALVPLTAGVRRWQSSRRSAELEEALVVEIEQQPTAPGNEGADVTEVVDA